MPETIHGLRPIPTGGAWSFPRIKSRRQIKQRISQARLGYLTRSVSGNPSCYLYRPAQPDLSPSMTSGVADCRPWFVCWETTRTEMIRKIDDLPRSATPRLPCPTVSRPRSRRGTRQATPQSWCFLRRTPGACCSRRDVSSRGYIHSNDRV